MNAALINYHRPHWNLNNSGIGTLWESTFFFNDTATTEIYTLSLHDALPIAQGWRASPTNARFASRAPICRSMPAILRRSEEHTSELQSRPHLVCRLLLE